MKKSFMDRFYIDDGKKELNKAMIGEVDEEVVLGVVAKSNFDGVYIDEVGALEKSSFYDIMEKGVAGAERAGHRWSSREMRPGGGYIYHYTHASGAKHDLHEDDGGGKAQIEGRTIREHGKKATEYAKAADEHFGAGREKEGMKNFKQAVNHREAQEILRHHYTSKGKNQ